MIDTPRGPIVLRPEWPEDGPFLLHLFAANRSGILRLAGLPDQMVEHLIQVQHQSQTRTYRTLFPRAQYWIIELADLPIGRLIEHDEQEVIYFTDIAILPAHQAQGLGSVLIGTLMRDWAARGRDARAKAPIDNVPSLKLFRRLGFVETGMDETAYVNLRWRRPESAVPCSA
jgi:GNAT superfamily N-acetyltransferase